ncbi:MAG: prepilin-type N-terminal cleavage/methylation domain-containing protein, partial [Desulfitobacterium hafniense]|nr:prepilin-type N-terminal cleavage/methylation domain-containing protein [Desulfitobacterium hafniense]
MKRDKGFTILEVMIAIAIFAFLMLIISQLMRGEIRLINNVTQKADLEHKARTAIMHVLDEIRLNRYT